MFLSPDDLRLATGLPLTQRQADSLAILGSFPATSRLNARTARALRRFGLIDALVLRGPRGGRRVIFSLTPVGLSVVRALNAACEYSPHCASIARLADIPVHVAYARQELGAIAASNEAR